MPLVATGLISKPGWKPWASEGFFPGGSNGLFREQPIFFLGVTVVKCLKTTTSRPIVVMATHCQPNYISTSVCDIIERQSHSQCERAFYTSGRLQSNCPLPRQAKNTFFARPVFLNQGLIEAQDFGVSPMLGSFRAVMKCISMS